MSYIYLNKSIDYPIGTIINYTGTAYSNTVIDNGWLLCDGTAYSTSTYVKLYNVIGYKYGGGSGTFYVPNFKGKFAYGNYAGNSNVTGGGDSFKLLSDNMPAHTHSSTNTDGKSSASPDHKHDFLFDKLDRDGIYGDNINQGDTNARIFNMNATNLNTEFSINSAGAHSHTFTTEGSHTLSGAQTEINLMPTYTAMHFIIKY
jgi:microcystin-dependent protein